MASDKWTASAITGTNFQVRASITDTSSLYVVYNKLTDDDVKGLCAEKRRKDVGMLGARRIGFVSFRIHNEVENVCFGPCVFMCCISERLGSVVPCDCGWMAVGGGILVLGGGPLNGCYGRIGV